MNMRVAHIIALGLGLLCSSVWGHSALAADKRVALIVGNSAYQNAPALPNPARDARAIAAMFTKAGYDVVSTAYDLGNLDFKRAVRQFEDAAADADIAVVYYAGHGIEIHGVNYVVPIDAKLASDRDADDEAIPLDRLIESVDGAKKLRVIILDACRDNPFSRTMKQQRMASRGITAGLSATEPSSINTLVAYAAKAGSQAEDGSGDHSPFATALMDNLFVPGLDVRLAFGRVRDEVLKKTGNRQEPFVYGSLGGGNVAIVSAPDMPAQAPAGTGAEADGGVRSDYNLVEKIGTKGAWQVFLTQHPSGFYAELAKAQISKLSSDNIVVASVDVDNRNLTTSPYAAAKAAPSQSTAVASIQSQQAPSPLGLPTSDERLAWDKIKDSSNEADYKDFIKRYPTSVLADLAQKHVDAIEQTAREQAAKAAEAQRQAQIADAKRQADEAARQKAIQDAALAAAQQAAKAAQQAQADAEREAALRRDEEAHKAALAALAKAQQQQQADAEATKKQQADADAARKQAEAAQQAAQAAEKARVEAQRVAQAQQEAACKNEQDRLTSLQAQGSKGRDDLKALQQGLTCERLRPMVVAALDKANALPDVNTPALIRSAQQELARVGCYSGTVDGSLSPTTTVAIQHYQSARGGKPGAVDVSDAFVSDLKKQSARVCPLVCSAGSVADGDKCIAATDDKSAPVAKQADTKPAAPKKQVATRPIPSAPRHEELEDAPRPAPHATEQASTASSTGHSGHGTMIGVGF